MKDFIDWEHLYKKHILGSKNEFDPEIDCRNVNIKLSNQALGILAKLKYVTKTNYKYVLEVLLFALDNNLMTQKPNPQLQKELNQKLGEAQGDTNIFEGID